MSFDFMMRKEDMDKYLNELAKELRKFEGRNAHFEIVIAGGASIVQNYTFRQMSSDIDAMINDRAIRDAARRVADKFDLPMDWINSDFEHTRSYTPALRGFSKYYRTFCHVLEVRTIEREYLIAMKLMSGRLYKNDFSDIIGILSESRQKGHPISKVMISAAMTDLYGGWDAVDETFKELFENIITQYENNPELYSKVRRDEQIAKSTLQYIEANYEGVVKEKTIPQILRDSAKTKDIFKITGKPEHEQSFIQNLDELMQKSGETVEEQDNIGARDKEEDLER